MRSWPLIKVLPTRTHFHFVRLARIMAIVSLIAVVASLGSVFYPGLNRGIDFRGGTVLEFSSPAAIDLGKVRSTLGALNLGDVGVQNFATKDDASGVRHVTISFQTPKGAEDAATVARVKGALNNQLGQVTYSRAEVVGPKVSAELFRNGILALLVAIGLMLVYIWFRFELQFGIGAVAALFHDVILTFGLIVLLRIEFDLRLIAAILTVIGYSMNDTVVVFDRLRENLRKYKKMSLSELIDQSINETLTRTIITGITAILALAGLAIFGGEALRGFSIVLMFGIAIGTYSSIYIAAPVVLIWGRKQRLAEEPEIIKPQPARP